VRISEKKALGELVDLPELAMVKTIGSHVGVTG
jgi:hypothetical protein